MAKLAKGPKPGIGGWQFLRHKQSPINAVVPLRRNEFIVPARGANKGGGIVPDGWTNPFPTDDWQLANRGDGRGNMTP